MSPQFLNQFFTYDTINLGYHEAITKYDKQFRWNLNNILLHLIYELIQYLTRNFDIKKVPTGEVGTFH